MIDSIKGFIDINCMTILFTLTINKKCCIRDSNFSTRNPWMIFKI